MFSILELHHIIKFAKSETEGACFQFFRGKVTQRAVSTRVNTEVLFMTFVVL